MKLKSNELLKKIIEESSNDHKHNILLDLENGEKLFNKSIISIFDTYILKDSDEQISIEIAKNNFDRLIKMNGDKTGYESSNNEIRIIDYVEKTNMTASEQWLIGLVVMNNLINKINFPEKFIFYFSYDDELLTIRFHKFRKEEGLWFNGDIENCEFPIGYFYNID
ncbi:hypothetical protein ACWOFR_12955 [Carnobacterium gallinarum]|uniref:hypothetical protein n=1 Tax=Carnobacterium gallinarum TaxID=2749 RepID=UPI000554F259|nr:hypothetical protein [Carnobacterium gallinarum]